MDGIKLFNAISKIDESLIDKYAAPEKAEKKPAKKRRIIIGSASAAAALVLVVGVIFGFVMIKKAGLTIESGSDPSKTLSAGGLFTLKAARDEVFYGGEEETPKNPGQYAYVFGKPGEEGRKYIGLYISEKAGQALRFNEDGTFSYYILKDASSYRYKFDGYYGVKDGRLTMYLITEELAGVCEVENRGGSIILKPENDGAMDFKKTENTLTKADDGYNGPDFKNALEFRNIPWTYDEEDLEITFGGNLTLVFYERAAMKRRDTKFEWNEQNNTVTIPDWHTPKGADWTGRIEDRHLILTSGDKTVTLYDPAWKKLENPGLYFPVDTYLCSADPYYSEIKLIFLSNGVYQIMRSDKGSLSYRTLYKGEYEIENPDETVNGQCLVITPSGETGDEYVNFIIQGGYQGSELRYFADLADKAGEKFIVSTTPSGGYGFTQTKSGAVTVTVCPDDRAEK